MPLEESFISINKKALKSEVKKASDQIGELGRRYLRAAAQAMLEFTLDTLSIAQERTPIREGRLRESAEIGDVFLSPDFFSIQGGFNLVYAAAQDLGAIIRPVTARALFIPLIDGATPGDPTLKLGVDFMLVPGPTTKKDFVEIPGNLYLTGIMPERNAILTQAVGRRTFEIMAAGGEVA